MAHGTSGQPSALHIPQQNALCRRSCSCSANVYGNWSLLACPSNQQQEQQLAASLMNSLVKVFQNSHDSMKVCSMCATASRPHAPQHTALIAPQGSAKHGLSRNWKYVHDGQNSVSVNVFSMQKVAAGQVCTSTLSSAPKMQCYASVQRGLRSMREQPTAPGLIVMWSAALRHMRKKSSTAVICKRNPL